MDFRKEVKAYEQAFIDDLRQLIQIDSTRDESTKSEQAPFGQGCRQALDTFLAMAKRDGFKVKDVDGYAGVAEYGDQAETFGLLGHLDIVPIGEDWTKPALDLTLSDGYAFGRGVIDDKGPALAAYYAMRMIKDLNLPLNRRLMFIAGCDEESGMECMDYYVQHGEIPQMGFVPDADFPVIFAEKGGLHVELSSSKPTKILAMDAGTRPNIVIGKAECELASLSEQEEAMFHFYVKANGLEGQVKRGQTVTLHIDGTFAHAAWPFKGVNAALHLLNFVGSCLSDELAKDLYEGLKDWMGQPLGIAQEGVHMGYLTMSVGRVIIKDGQTYALLDIRYPNDTTGQEVCDKIAAYFKDKDVQATLASDSAPLFVDPNSELVQTLLSVYQKYTGDTFSQPLAIGGGTYARKFENFVSFGPEKPVQVKRSEQFLGGPHQRDESVWLEDLFEAIAIYAEAIVRLCSDHANA